MSSLPELVAAHMEKLAPNAETVLVAVSGGPDSVALLRLLVGGRYRLEVAHFDHQLRPDAGADAAFVAALAEAMELPFYLGGADVAEVSKRKGWNLEDGARRLRYSFLTRTAKRVGADVVATGHTRDDQAETVIMHLLRGAVFLKGMRSRRGRVARPLLNISRRQLVDYLEEVGQTFRVDATNRDTALTRAWLRHEVLPLLEARYPEVKTTLARLAEVQSEQESELTARAEALISEGQAALKPLLRASVAVQRQVIGELLETAAAPITFASIERIRMALTSESPTRISVSSTHNARVAYGSLALVENRNALDLYEPVEYAKDLPTGVDPAILETHPNLVYRTRLPGDTIRLSGGSKKLSDLLIDKKIPREDRDGFKVLAADKQVFWIEGVAVDPSVARETGPGDAHFMRLALEQARQAAVAGELPIGAVVVKSGVVLAEAHNETETRNDPSAHAEVLALRRAAEALGDWRLEACTLYVTLEPCPMCFGALLQAHLPQLVYGAPNLREGALGTVTDLRQAGWKRKVEVKAGVLEQACARLLTEFFGRK